MWLATYAAAETSKSEGGSTPTLASSPWFPDIFSDCPCCETPCNASFCRSYIPGPVPFQTEVAPGSRQDDRIDPVAMQMVLQDHEGKGSQMPYYGLSWEKCWDPSYEFKPRRQEDSGGSWNWPRAPSNSPSRWKQPKQRAPSKGRQPKKDGEKGQEPVKGGGKGKKGPTGLESPFGPHVPYAMSPFAYAMPYFGQPPPASAPWTQPDSKSIESTPQASRQGLYGCPQGDVPGYLTGTSCSQRSVRESRSADEQIPHCGDASGYHYP